MVAVSGLLSPQGYIFKKITILPFSVLDSVLLCIWFLGTVRSFEPSVIPHITDEAELEQYYKSKKTKDISDSSSFARVVQDKTFVDKSLLIKEYFDFEKFIYLTAPPRYGKTTNNDMNYRFLDAETFPNGSIIEAMESTENFHYFKNTKLFREHPDFVSDHFQKYKVINMDFRPLINVRDEITFKEGLSIIVCNMMMQYSFLKEMGASSTWFNHTSSEERCLEYANSESLEFLASAGRELTEELHKVYGKKVIVLCDEYDAFLHAIILHPELDERTTVFLSTNLGTFVAETVKNNRVVVGCIFIGTLTLGGVISAFANNVYHYHTNKEPALSKYFGYTQDDVDRLLRRFDVYNARKDVELWYGSSTSKKALTTKLYCPISVNSYLKSNEFKSYWVEQVAQEELLTCFCSHPRFGSEVVRILFGNSPEYRFSERKPKRETISAIKNCAIGKKLESLDFDGLMDLIKLVAENGYFTRQPGKSTNTEILEPPNYEIADYLSDVLYNSEFLPNLLQLQKDEVVRFRVAVSKLTVKDKTIENLAEAIHLHFKNICPINDERTGFHGVMYGSLVNQKAESLVKGIKLVYTEAKITLPRKTKSNKQVLSKSGLQVITDENVAIIMEAKVNNKSEKALEQIYQNGYPAVFEQNFPEYDIKHKIFMGINIDRSCVVSISYVFDSKGPADFSKAKTVHYPKFDGKPTTDPPIREKRRQDK